MKNLLARFMCWFKKRHEYEYLKNNGGKFHQYYGVNGGGVWCTCPKCGRRVLFLREQREGV